MQGFNHRTLDIFYTDRSKAVFLGLVVLIVAFWMHLNVVPCSLSHCCV